MLSALKTSIAVTEEGDASRSLLNSSNHQRPGKTKPVGVTHPLSTNGVLQGVGDKESLCLPMAQEIHLREKLCCHYSFQDRLWDVTRNGKINTLYSKHRVFKVTKTIMNALNSPFLIFHFKIKIIDMVLIHKNLSRPGCLRDHLSICSLPEHCAFTTLLQIGSQDGGFIWVFEMGEPGYEKNCHFVVV